MIVPRDGRFPLIFPVELQRLVPPALAGHVVEPHLSDVVSVRDCTETPVSRIQSGIKERSACSHWSLVGFWTICYPCCYPEAIFCHNSSANHMVLAF
jgi:hypothetical protein